MNHAHERFLQNVNADNRDLERHNNPSLWSRIKNAMAKAWRQNIKRANLSAEYDIFKFIRSFVGARDGSEC